MAHVTLLAGSQGAGIRTSEASSRQDGTTLNYHHPLGSRAFDSAGNEYVYVEFGAAVYSGIVVGITSTYLACAPFVDAAFHGPVGVVQGAATSDQAGWVMVRGATNVQLGGGNSAVTSSMHFEVASSVTSPATAADLTSLANSSDEHYHIYGMWPTGAAETGTTSATSHTGVYVPALLHYPYVTGQLSNHTT